MDRKDLDGAVKRQRREFWMDYDIFGLLKKTDNARMFYC